MPRRWSELSGVERVGLYTRTSLYVLLWGFNASILVAAVLTHGGGERAAALLAGGAVVTAASCAALVAALHRFPVAQPLSLRYVAPLVGAAAAYYVIAVTSWSGGTRGAAVLVVVVSLIMPLALAPGRRVAVALLAGGSALLWIAGGEVVNAAAGLLSAAAFVFTVRASMWLYGIVTELDTARQAQAQLAVVEERLRFSRDVHDVLGRRLSTIAVQAELAATLAGRLRRCDRPGYGRPMTALRVALVAIAVLAVPASAQAGTASSDGTTITYQSADSRRERERRRRRRRPVRVLGSPRRAPAAECDRTATTARTVPAVPSSCGCSTARARSTDAR